MSNNLVYCPKCGSSNTYWIAAKGEEVPGLLTMIVAWPAYGVAILTVGFALPTIAFLAVMGGSVALSRKIHQNSEFDYGCNHCLHNWNIAAPTDK